MKRSTFDGKGASKYLASFLDITVVAAIYILAQVVGGVMLLVFADPGSIPSYLMLAIYMTTGTLMGGLLYKIIRATNLSKKQLLLKAPSGIDMLYAVAGFLCYFVLTIIVGTFARLIPGVDVSERQDLGLDGVNPLLLPIAFVALVVLPPLVEELLFRGFLYQRFRLHGLGRYLSSLVVSSLFGLVHGQVNVAIDTFVLSMVIIYFMELRKNIWVAIAMHAIKNCIAFVILFVLKGI